MCGVLRFLRIYAIAARLRSQLMRMTFANAGAPFPTLRFSSEATIPLLLILWEIAHHRDRRSIIYTRCKRLMGSLPVHPNARLLRSYMVPTASPAGGTRMLTCGLGFVT